MTTRLFLSNGLPPRIVDQATRAFRQLDGAQHPLPSITTLLCDVAVTHNFSDPAAIERVFSALVAANHTFDRLTGPPPPLPTNSPDVLPSRTEWLLLASRERALAAWPDDLGIALDALIAEFDAFGAADAQAGSPPIVDYGLGSLLAAIAGKGPDSSEFVAGNALGKLARLMVEVLLAGRSSMPLLRPVLLRFVTGSGSAREHLSMRLDTAVAMACKPVPDKLPLFSFLGNPDVRASVVEACATWQDQVRRAVGGTNAMVALAESIRDEIAAKLDSLRLFGFAKPPPVIEELERAIQLAIAALMEDPELKESWDVQRWGGWFTNPRIGRFFPMGLCALALHAGGVDIEQSVQNLLLLRRADGFPYFEDFPEIPPDADDLGMALQLAARLSSTSQRMEQFAWPLTVLERNTAVDGSIPVWFELGLQSAIPPAAPQWLGSRCIAAVANLLVGMIEANVEPSNAFLERAVQWLFQEWRNAGMAAVYFYGPPYTRFILSRLTEVARSKLTKPGLLEQIAVVRDELAHAIRADQRADGGFGGIVASACHLAAMAHLSDMAFDPWPTITYIASRQRPDGSWAAEPVYLTIGKDNTVVTYESRAVTTALSLSALAKARMRWPV